MGAVMVHRHGIRTRQILLNRGIGLPRAVEIAGLQSRPESTEVFRQLQALHAGARGAFGQSAKSFLSVRQIAGLKGLSELLELGPLLLVVFL